MASPEQFSMRLSRMGGYELREASMGLWENIQADTFDMFRARHLLGTLRRFRNVPRGQASSMLGVQAQLDHGIDVTGHHQDVQVSLINRGGEWVGLQTITQPGGVLRLRAPRSRASGLLPAALTRRSERLSRDISPEGPHVLAWVAMRDDDEQLDALSTAYRQLCEEAGEGAWTVEPIRSAAATEAIRAAGMEAPLQHHPDNPFSEATIRPRRYDDIEAPGMPPLSQYYEFRP